MSDSVEPPVEDQAPAMEGRMPERRNVGGWIILLILFGLLVTNSFISSITPGEGPKEYREEEALLRSYLMQKSLQEVVGGPSLGSAEGPLEERLPDLLQDSVEHREAAALYAVISHELKKKVDPKALQSLAKGQQSRTRAIGKIYAEPKLSTERANALVKEVGDGPMFTRVAKVHAREKAGIVPSGRSDLSPITKLFALGVMVALIALFILAGGIAWIAFFAMRSQGSLKPLGMPLGPLSAADTDRLAWKAALVMLAFVGISQGMASIRTSAPLHPAFGALPPILVIILIVALNRITFFGKRVPLSEIGVNRKDLGKNILWGFAGFCAELPIALGLTLLGTILLKFLPPPKHPATELLQNNQSIAVVLTVLILASVMAPVWEEIMFRGLLFPALSRCMGILGGALFSSFLFAAIHPQGIVLWLGLGTIAAVSCALVNQTKSLVPSIVMHALHNTTILLLGLSAL